MSEKEEKTELLATFCSENSFWAADRIQDLQKRLNIAVEAARDLAEEARSACDATHFPGLTSALFEVDQLEKDEDE